MPRDFTAGREMGVRAASLPAARAVARWRPWLGQFRAILLDMNGTFMFGHDRFGPGAGYAATYGALGGGALLPEEAEAALHRFVASFSARYADPACAEDFPSVAEGLRALLPGLPAEEIARLEAVVAAHELGHIPTAHAATIALLAETHMLGVVSNLWSARAPWMQAFARAALDTFFDTIVFSSDHRCLKPSPRLFRVALDALGLAAEEVLFIGDDLRRDIAGAQRLGMATLWIGGGAVPFGQAAPDATLGDLCELLR